MQDIKFEHKRKFLVKETGEVVSMRALITIDNKRFNYKDTLVETYESTKQISLSEFTLEEFIEPIEEEVVDVEPAT